ncbi:DUF5684 domain-containing protein [Agromyces sp. MMS24-JH15]|uniref:DUF5684 domain-containing protein n=1 Tax=Agromyces sp. MMS24-JH15 TaxID=3243765 RepID=UPI0037494EBB
MTDPAAAQALALLGVLLLVWSLIGVAVYIWTGIAFAKLFARLSAEPWRGWVPVLNVAEVFALAGMSRWTVLLLAVPVVSLYGLWRFGVAAHRIGALFGRGVGFAVLAVFVSPLWATLLAFSRVAPDHDRGRFEPVPDASLGWLATGPLADLSAGNGGAPAPVAPAPVSVVPVPVVPAPVEFASVAPAPAPVAPAFAPVEPVFAPPAPAPVGLEAAQVPAPAPAPAPAQVPLPILAPAPAAASDDRAPVPPVVPLSAWAPPRAQAGWPAAPSTSADAPPAPAADAEEPAAFAAHAEVEASFDFAAAATIVPGGQMSAVLLAEAPAVAEAPAAPAAPAAAAATPAPVVEEDDYEVTVVVDRRPRVTWLLLIEDGPSQVLAADRVVLGRNPLAADGEQALAVPDPTRTLSKTHARLELEDGRWTITDLGSTNGVLIDEGGVERLVDAHVAVPATGRFVLGEVGMRIEIADEP